MLIILHSSSKNANMIISNLQLTNSCKFFDRGCVRFYLEMKNQRTLLNHLKSVLLVGLGWDGSVFLFNFESQNP